MSVAIAFDTHHFVKRLTDCGFTEKQAETLADEHVALLNSNLVTKADGDAFRHTIDTHRFVKRLTDCGFTEQQAETLADEHVTLLSSNLATKADSDTLWDTIRDAYFQPLKKPLHWTWRWWSAFAGSAVFFIATYVVLFGPIFSRSATRRSSAESPGSAQETSNAAAAIPERIEAYLYREPVELTEFAVFAFTLSLVYTSVAAGFPTRQGPVRLFLTGLLLPTLSVYLVRAVWSN